MWQNAAPLPFLFFFFKTPLFFLIFPIQSAKRLDILAPYSDSLYKMPQGCVIPTTLGFHEHFPHCQSYFASICFLKEQPCLILWTMMRLLLSPPSRTVIHFRACSAELDCIMHSTHVHRQNYSPECMQAEWIAETSKSPFLRTDFISQCTPKMGGRRSMVFLHHWSPMLLDCSFPVFA